MGCLSGQCRGDLGKTGEFFGQMLDPQADGALEGKGIIGQSHPRAAPRFDAGFEPFQEGPRCAPLHCRPPFARYFITRCDFVRGRQKFLNVDWSEALSSGTAGAGGPAGAAPIEEDEAAGACRQKGDLRKRLGRDSCLAQQRLHRTRNPRQHQRKLRKLQRFSHGSIGR
jgi:hypothetical protein